MYDYYTALAIKVDLLLAILLVFLTAVIALYSILKELGVAIRDQALMRIKKNVYAMVLTGRKADKIAAHGLASATAGQFLDVTTNRNRDAVFFNAAEQKLFKDIYITPRQISRLERTARFAFNKWRRIEAIMSLGQAQSEGSIKVLEKTVKSRDEDVSYFSIIALGQIKTVASAKVLLAFLKTHTFGRYRIATVLEGFPDEATDEAVMLADDPEATVRFWAAKILSKLKARKHLKKVEAMTGDSSGDVRAAACECLGIMGAKESKEVLIKCLKDNYWLVRASSLEALEKVLGRDFLPYAAASVNDGSLSVIETVKHVIGAHIEDALPYLAKFLEGKDLIAKRVAIESIEESGYMPNLLKAAAMQDPSLPAAKSILNGMFDAGAHFGFESALKGFDGPLRSKALDLIRGMNPDFAEHIEERIKGLGKNP